MAVSRNTTSLSRRTLVAGIGGLSASIAAPAVVSLAQEPHPDAVLLELGRQLRLKSKELTAMYDKQSEYYDAAHATCSALPDVLRYTDEDRAFGFPEPDDERWPGYHAPWPAYGLERYSVVREVSVDLSEFLQQVDLKSFSEVLIVKSGKAIRFETWPEADERRNQILQAAEAIRVARDETVEQQRFDDFEEETRSVHNEQWDIVERITEEPAHTLDGLAVKALAVQLVNDPDSEVKLGEYPFDELVSSALNGLIRLSKPV